MTENKTKTEITNGWILCPSKRFPGKFYYFNVINGEAAWSLNQSDNKGFLKERSFDEIADKYHRYPEPTTLPDNIFTYVKKLDCRLNIPHNRQLFPNYVTNAEPLIPNIVCTPVASQMFCPETKKPMFDHKLSEFDHCTISEYSNQTNIPISKRFTNYQKPCFNSYKYNKIAKPISKLETSTPKNLFLECASELQNVKSNEKVFTSFSSKVESTKSSAKVPKFVKNEEDLENLDSSDLRFLLLAKRRSTAATDTAVERKKPKPIESNPLTLTKKVTFNLKDETDDDDTANDNTQQDFTSITPNLTRTIPAAPKSPVLLRDKTQPSFINVSPKTSPPNIEDEPPAGNYQRPTFEQAANYQCPTCQPAANYQCPTCQPSANFQRPTCQPTANYQRPTCQPTANYQHPTCQPIVKYQRPTLKNTWYIVVDTDVLLLDYEFIDQVVLSDRRCRLIIPSAVAADIEELCLGDCHGQQRVINARRLTRKLATPPPHYIVEPRNKESGNIIVMTTDSILHCCMKISSKNYYVALITNDPHLQIRATLLNIQSYKLNEIKYGAEIRPKKKMIKMNTRNDDVTDSNQYNQSIFSNLEIDEKNMKNNDIDGKNQYNNHTLFSYHASPVKKQLILSDSNTDTSLDCDEFITTQPKGLKNTENINKPDFDCLSDISSEVSSLNLTDKNVLKAQNGGRNPFVPQNVKENCFVDFGKRILNPKIVFNNRMSIRRTIPNKKPSPENHDFQKDIFEYNFENTETSTPITNMKLFESKSKFESSVEPVTSNTSLSRQEPFDVTRNNKILNSSQTRIRKIIRTVNNDSTSKNQLDNQIPKTKDSTGLFKIHTNIIIPIKNATHTSVHAEKSTMNDRICTRTNIDSIDEDLTRFRIKSMNMKNKIKTRIDEWICSFMQIMEDTLMHILQKNCVCMENTVAPLTLKDTLNCIKMLFGSHTKIRDLTNKLSELLEKCMLCTQGKPKMSLIPEDFMKLFGYGVLLVHALKNIHPQSQELKEAELRLNNLQIILESNTKEFDPELVKSSLSKSDLDQGLEEVRPQFIKNKSYVIDYLKKHFKEWETYTEDLDDQNHKIENHTDFKVVRTIGKNLNLLKIDNKKMMTLSNNTLEEDLDNRNKEKPRLIRLLENNQIIKPEINENVKINTKNETKLIGRGNNENKQNDFDCFLDENKNDKDVPLKKLVENIDKGQNNEPKVNKEFNYTTHKNTFVENTEKDGPKIIRNTELIDEFEKKKFNNKDIEPLDLDLFYSEIYEPYDGGNLIDFDVISEKNKNSQGINKNNHFEDNNNYGLDNTMCTLEDFYITPSISPDSIYNNKTSDLKNAENSSKKNNETKISENVTSHYFNSVPGKNGQNAHIEEKTDKNNSEVESETYTENGNSEIHIGYSKPPNNDSGMHLDNSDTSFGKSAQIVRDDSTNNSGFENDSTYAHSLIKIFLNELSSTFKVIHTFVTEFIDEIRETELSGKRKDALHNQASKALEDMVAIIKHLRSIIKRESAENTVLKTLLRNAGVEATTDKRMTRYKQLVIKCLEQALVFECALKVIVSTTMDDFEALSTNTEVLNSNLRYFNIFELE